MADIFAGWGNQSQQDFLREANSGNAINASTHLPGYSGQKGGAAAYEATVVLDPYRQKNEIQRMNQLVEQGIYTLQQDSIGRAVYTLTPKGQAHNTRDIFSNPNATYRDPMAMSAAQQMQQGQAKDYSSMSMEELNMLAADGNMLAERAAKNKMDQQNLLEAGRAGTLSKTGMNMNQELGAVGAQAALDKYGSTSPSAPTHTTQGQQLQYRAGNIINVASKEQAQAWVAAGVVEKGAKFRLPDGTIGTAG